MYTLVFMKYFIETFMAVIKFQKIVIVKGSKLY